jgi:hypothetical protein
MKVIDYTQGDTPSQDFDAGGPYEEFLRVDFDRLALHAP